MDIPHTDIVFPCLIRTGNWLIAINKSGFKDLGLKYKSNDLYAYTESVSARPHIHWLIQADGLFREFEVVGHGREWLRLFRFIWPLVRIDCVLKPGRRLTVGETRSLLSSIARDGASPDDELRLDLEFTKFLKENDESETLTAEMVRAFIE